MALSNTSNLNIRLFTIQYARHWVNSQDTLGEIKTEEIFPDILCPKALKYQETTSSLQSLSALVFKKHMMKMQRVLLFQHRIKIRGNIFNI